MNDCNPLRCIGLKAHWLLVEFMAPVIAWQYRLHSQNALILKKSLSLLIAIQQTNLISVHLSIAGLIYGTWDDKYTVSKNKRWTTKTWKWRQTNIYIYKALWFSKERRIGNVDGIFYKIWPGARTIRKVLYIHINCMICLINRLCSIIEKVFLINYIFQPNLPQSILECRVFHFFIPCHEMAKGIYVTHVCASSELFWSPVVCRLSVCLSVNCSHFWLFLQNHRAIFNQTWHKGSLGIGGSIFFKWRATSFSKGR